MKPNWLNVFMISLVMILAATTGLSLYLSHNQTIIPPQEKVEESWLPIPPGGMDASLYVNRYLLKWSLSRSIIDNDGLADYCGRDTDELFEKYIIETGPVLGPGKFINLSINISNNDATVIAEMQNHTLSPTSHESLDEKPKVFLLKRKDIEQLQTALIIDGHWLENQTSRSLNCLDGFPLRVQACINGKYYEKIRDCENIEVKNIWLIASNQFFK